MNKDKVVVFLDNGHCASTPGKKSPDGTLREYLYAREIVNGIVKELKAQGINYYLVHPEDDYVILSKGTCKDLDSRDLVLRCSRINEKYAEVKKQGKTAFLISVHVNAAGNGEWMKATGWSAWTTKGQNNSDKLAEKLYDAAEEILKPLGKTVRIDKSDGDRDYESDFYILKKSNCVCTLTENFFMDYKNDVEFLLSEEGKKAIIDLHVKGIEKYITSF
jgi:N-acetylmuramoyl-L-alanine amidase